MAHSGVVHNNNPYVWIAWSFAEPFITVAQPLYAVSEPLVVPGVPADCNEDSLLDAADVSCVAAVDARDIVLQALNTLPGDLDGNGDVSLTDF